MKRKLVTCVSCQSGEQLWCFDEQLCALCKINKENLQAECVVSPMEVLEDETYEVRKLIAWRDKILILPVQLNQQWVIYDINTGKLEYGNFCTENHRSGASVLMGDRLVLLPVCIENPLIFIDLQEKEIIDRQYLRDPYLISKEGMEIWEASVNQGKVYFLIRGTSYYGEIEDGKVRLVSIQAPEPLWCADFCERGGWAVGSKGNYLYQFDEKGNLVDSFSVQLKTEIVRILMKQNKVFLILTEGKGIWMFDKDSGKVRKIDMAREEEKATFPPFSGILDYWDYVETQNRICFLPLRHPMQVIDVETGRDQQKVITYSDDFSKRDYWSYCNYVRKIRWQCPFFNETLDGDFGNYLELIQGDISISKEKEKLYGEKIWDCLGDK